MTASSRYRESGFLLIETLVAVIVLAIGLLGVSALQISMQKSNQSALRRSQANMLAYYMMDAMRANKNVALLGSYDVGNLSTNTPVCTAPTGSTLIVNDQSDWFQALKSNLGNLSSTCGLINCTATSCTVSVYWDDSRSVGGGTTQTITVKSRI
jgi:type IV pilus assembly protein PilV